MAVGPLGVHSNDLLGGDKVSEFHLPSLEHEFLPRTAQQRAYTDFPNQLHSATPVQMGNF